MAIDRHTEHPDKPALTTDMGKPPSGHHPREGTEGEKAKVQGPDHMRDELNPTVGGHDQQNKGQERREQVRRVADRIGH